MSQPQQNISLQAPAFQGVNTQDSPLSQDVTYASRADNAVIDALGRVGSRKGFRNYVNSYDISGITPPAGWTTRNITIHSMQRSEGVAPIVGMAVAWYDVSEALLSTTYHFGFVDIDTKIVTVVDIPAPHNVESVVKGQIVAYNGANNTNYYVFGGTAMLTADPVAETVVVSSTDPNWLAPQDDNGVYSADVDGDVACAAYGRIWVSGVGGNNQRIYYSNLENPVVWYDGRAVPDDSQNTAGIIDVSQYWPNGVDRIQGIIAHNNMLVVFGRNSILLYGNPQGDPAAVGGIFLQDAIEGLGLVNRDALCSTGADVLFVDDTGVRSLGRSIQEQSSPIGDLTLNVRKDIIASILTSLDKTDITLSYWPQESLVVCNFAGEAECYVLDQRRPSSSGGARITTWSSVSFDRSIHVEDGNDTVILLGGKSDLLHYDGGVDNANDSYVYSYESNPLSLGDSVRQKFPKRMDVTVVSRNQPSAATARWGFGGELTYSKALTIEAEQPAYFGSAQFGVDSFGAGPDTVKRYRVNTKGSGALLRMGVSATISGGEFSLQELNIQLLLGRIY